MLPAAGATVDVLEDSTRKKPPLLNEHPDAARAWLNRIPGAMQAAAEFDSVKGTAAGETIFVTFAQAAARAYPRYIVTYTSSF